MYDKEVYEGLRKEVPGCFDIAEELYSGILSRGMLVVRALVSRTPKNRMYEIARIEVIDLERRRYPLDSNDRNVLLRLSFRAEVNFHENAIEMLETSLEASGPHWNDKPIGREDIVNHVGTFVHEWSENKTLALNEAIASNPWVESSLRPFVGCLAFSNDTFIDVGAHHPLLLPFITMCFASLQSSLDEKLKAVTSGSSTCWSANTRKNAVDSLMRRFGSLVVQAQRVIGRSYLSNFFEP